MQKYLMFFFLLCLFSIKSIALDCGQYYGQGLIKEKNHTLIFIANEKSKSELNLIPDVTLETKLAPFLNRPVNIKFTINKKFDGNEGSIATIDTIELRAANPRLGANDQFVKLINKAECDK